jgi:putative transposase
MRKARFSEEQMVAIIREADRDLVAAAAKRHGISEQTIYTWRERFGGFEVNDVRRLKQLEVENARLKKLVAERDLEIEVMKAVAAKNGERAGSPAATCVWPGAWSLGTAGLHAVLGGAIGAELPQPHGSEGRGRDRADEGAFGAVSALRLPPHPHFSRP